MKYILVRHVETVGNAERRLNGHTESEYTDYGLAMKAILEDALVALNDRMPIDAIYASPIQRAYQIGKTVAERLGLECVTEDDLKEFNFGIFDGLTADEAMAKDPETWNRWMADYNFVQLPGGERYEDYHNRLKAFLERHAEAHADKTVLIVAHGGTVHSLLVNLLDLPLASKWHFNVRLGSITIVDCPEGYGILEALYTPDYSQIEI
ncbi:MAG: histidine phosphatase family protein [Eubacterium sp.]|nr:histidine phosphatase family protein [Eubacterium sp.]